MTAAEGRIEIRALRSERLDLEPLRRSHATEMAPLLDDPGLHTFIGGEPASAEELDSRYARQIVGHSADGSERWLNWVVRRRDSGQAVGTVQATVREQDGNRGLVAEVAWVIVTSQQGRGYAQEAAQTMLNWLQRQGVELVIAHVSPGHAASIAVAGALGLAPTDMLVDGEVRWQV